MSRISVALFFLLISRVFSQISGIIFDKNTLNILYSDKLQNALYWILDYVENFYLKRLGDTKEQMKITKRSIDNYLQKKLS